MVNGVTNTIGNALGGLKTSQTLLSTTTRNLVNSGTEGYRRKTQETFTDTNTGGVRAGAIQRQVNEFLIRDMRKIYADRAMTEARIGSLERLDALSGASNDISNLSAKVTELGNAFQRLATDPTRPLSYTQVIHAADELANTFREIYAGIEEIGANAEQVVQEEVIQANRLLERVADINARIVEIDRPGADLSDLLDERDKMLDDLSEIIEIRGFVDDRNIFHAYSKNGKYLTGETANQLQAGADGSITIKGEPVINAGGRLGGLEQVIKRDIPFRLDQLDDLAGRLTEALVLPQNGGPPAPPPVAVFSVDGLVPHDPANEIGYGGRIALNEAIRNDPDLLRGGAVTPVGDVTVATDARDVLLTNSYSFTAAGLPSTGGFQQVATEFTASLGGDVADANARLSALQASEDLVAQAISVGSDVNIDDEMARMIVLQNAYTASARVMQTTKEMLDELLSLLR